MPSPISINIKLDIAVQEFLKSAHPQNHGYDGFLFPKRSKHNQYLELLLSRAPEHWQEAHYGELNFRVVLPYCETINVLYNYYLSDRSQRVFADWVRALFYAEFHRFCDKHIRFGTKPKAATELFMETYNLTEDDKLFQKLTKDYYRYRKEYKKKL